MKDCFNNWIPIKGFEGKYEINLLGQVKSVSRKIGKRNINAKILRPVKRGKRFVYGLSKNGVVCQKYAHILVADNFKRENKFLNYNDEVWKNVVKNSLYEVSNHGRVRKKGKFYDINSFTFCKYKEIVPNNNGQGYLFINLFIDGKHIRKYIHRLVAEKFIANPKNLPEVNHIDGIKIHNFVGNLEWISRLGNAEHASKNGLLKSGTRSVKSKLTNDDIDKVKYMFLSKRKCISEIMNELNVDRHCILRILEHETYIHERLYKKATREIR